MSFREREIRRERLEFENQLRREQRNAEDRQQYESYTKQMRAEHLELLNFEEWLKFVPDEQGPKLRGAIASATSTVTRTVKIMSEMAATQSLDDDSFSEYGFDLEDRPRTDAELSPFAIKLALKAFVKKEQRWETGLHWDALREFMIRNKLNPTAANFARAFSLLCNLGVIQPKPEPEPKQPEGLNEYGVNISIEHDPMLGTRLAAQSRQQEYGTKIVAVGPDGQEYTQYQLDRLSADDFKKAMRLFGDRLPKFSNVIGPDEKLTQRLPMDPDQK